ncbi:AraC family transcriptional regulator [Zhouia spongiae]|uniref:AraC family transcriptional regulator n=1 Tax=Zhouia spongiae TaxID=2202721 RepID=A0ABY3YJI5_9FLAO|nr:AraC family transcriptional regulator [Zhouia spongiae]UNY97802.1 AraC family transcriptional regulator [Zhouia spongiae]
MKPIPFKIPKSEGSSLRVQIDEGPHFYDRLHYHNEIQVTTIQKGEGILYSGNNMVQFNPGDTFILGSNIPHLMKSAKPYFSPDSNGVYSVSLFFDQNSFGSDFFHIPELKNIYALLGKSKRGIKVIDDCNKYIHQQILEMVDLKNTALIIQLLHILNEIDKTSKNYINSDVYRFSINEKDGQRLNDIISYTFNRLEEDITIEDIASIANLSRSQFSRYFKLHTRKTYIEFLNELRIESACNLLLDKKNTIENICYDVGFKNLSNFNRQFKKIKQLTPSEYRSIRLK